MQNDSNQSGEGIISIGPARFTFISERILRLEYSKQGVFEDLPSLTADRHTLSDAAINYARQDNNWHCLQCSQIKVRFLDNGLPFNSANLEVQFADGGRTRSWHPGLIDDRNLGGTARTLDYCNGPLKLDRLNKTRGAATLKIEQGLFSRNGWAVIDDSGSIVLGQTKSGSWVRRREQENSLDWYFLAFGSDFSGGLAEASSIFGRQPLPPRYAFGYWWSRYWAYTDKELENLVESLEEQSLPLDVLVVDTDWHKQGWTGFSWDESYFPDWKEFLRWAKEKSLHISMNLHPADGYGPHEDSYDKAAKLLGIDPKTQQRIPFDCTCPKNMQVYFKEMLKPYEDCGVEFWWLDWQQGEKSALDGLDPLPWLNRLHWQHLAEEYPDRRPLGFSRYGGLGAGRYPVGFSGDVFVSWDSLTLQPFFTARAANALYGYWSHDIGGHICSDRYLASQPELLTRWLQFGIFSPILRTHVTKHAETDRQFWESSLPYSRIMKNLLRQRYEWLPYIYTEARSCYDSGVSLCRPMYYHFPEEENAYQERSQYFFGKDVFVCPITEPIDKKDDAAVCEVWLPPGQWFDLHCGEVLQGPALLKRRYLLEEIPVFVRAGSVIPMQKDVLRLRPGGYPNLTATAFPGGSGHYRLYEDDGVSNDYSENICGWSELRQERTESNLKITIRKSEGQFEGQLDQRPLFYRIPLAAPPVEVRINGKNLKWRYRLAEPGWTYEGDSCSIWVQAGMQSTRVDNCLELSFNGDVSPDSLQRFRGAVSRLKLAFDYGRRLGLQWERDLAALAQTGNRISRRPDGWHKEISAFWDGISNIIKAGEELRLKLLAQKESGIYPPKVEHLEKALRIIRLIEAAPPKI